MCEDYFKSGQNERPDQGGSEREKNPRRNNNDHENQKVLIEAAHETRVDVLVKSEDRMKKHTTYPSEFLTLMPMLEVQAVQEGCRGFRAVLFIPPSQNHD